MPARGSGLSSTLSGISRCPLRSLRGHTTTRNLRLGIRSLAGYAIGVARKPRTLIDGQEPIRAARISGRWDTPRLRWGLGEADMPNKRVGGAVPELMKGQIEDHQRVIASASEQTGLFEQIADRIRLGFDAGARLFLLGNGGSAADAQHIAAELVGRFKRDRKALPAIALTTDSSILTAITNDIGGEYNFARQIEALVTDRDIVWALSVSGRSPNVLRALEAARRIGAFSIGFTGRSGGQLEESCDLCFKADHDASDRVQEAHQLAYHLICDRIERQY